MLVDYIHYRPSDELNAIAEWTERLLPSNWLDHIPHDTSKRLPHLLGRMLLFRRLSLLGYAHTNLPRLYYTPEGKPYFAEQLYFNIAYTNDLIVIAFSERQEVGIDVEQIRPLSWQSFESYFTHEEWTKIARLKYPSKKLINYWVIKEAASKLTGEGLDIPYHKIKIKKNTIRLDKIAYHHQELNLLSHCVAHIVTPSPCKNLVINNITYQLAAGLRVVRA